MLRCSFKKDNGIKCKIKTHVDFCHVHTNMPECSICYGKINKNTLYTSECNHAFHTTCIETWLERDNSCPLCRSELPQEKYTVAISDDPIMKQFTPAFYINNLKTLEKRGKFKGSKLVLNIIDEHELGVYNFHTCELLGTFKIN